MSEFQTPDERPVLFDRETLIAGLEKDERFRALRAALDDSEKEFTEYITRVLLHSSRPLDQRKIDFTRGYFAGAREYTGGRVQVAKTRLQTPEGEAHRPVDQDDPRRSTPHE
jgi:hypothetical protein